MNTSITDLYQIYLQHPVVSTDSRKITKGSIFFALSGEHFDGNNYAIEALDKGASYAVVDNPDVGTDERLIYVEDSLLALQELAALHRATLSKPVIAITGTNGKTTTKELSAQVLSSTFKVLYTEGNLNNHIGVPLTLLRMRDEHDFAIIEMGANKPGDIAELCEIAQPNYGVITNIGEAHLEGFKSIIGVERTKAELYDWLKQNDGKVIRKEEDERLTRLSQNIPCVTYGQSPEAVIKGEVTTKNSLYLQFTWEVPEINIAAQSQTTKLVGTYNIDNALVAIALGVFFGVEVEKIRRALAEYTPSNSRSQYIQTKTNEVILDAYNANPSSMKEAIDNFLSLTSERSKLMILGDMNELGDNAKAAHQEIYQILEPYLRSETLQALFCGPQWSQLLEAQGRLCFDRVDSLRLHLVDQPVKDRFILIKGSNSIKLDSLLSTL